MNNKQATHNEKREPVPNLEEHKKDTFITQDDTTSEARWHFKKYLDDPATPKLAVAIFRNDKWELTSENDGELLSFPEKLTGNDKEARPFYFKMVTNSAKKADGAFSEGLGNAGYEYVLNNTAAFTSYFAGPGAFSNKDLEIWAGIVIGELGITEENDRGQYNKNAANEYIASLKSNCKNCSAEQKKVLDRFGTFMKDQWSELLKNNAKSE